MILHNLVDSCENEKPTSKTRIQKRLFKFVYNEAAPTKYINVILTVWLCVSKDVRRESKASSCLGVTPAICLHAFPGNGQRQFVEPPKMKSGSNGSCNQTEAWTQGCLVNTASAALRSTRDLSGKSKSLKGEVSRIQVHCQNHIPPCRPQLRWEEV